MACAGAALLDCKAWSSGPAGVEEQGKGALGIPRNVRDLTAATSIPGGVPGNQLQVRCPVRGRRERNSGHTRGIVVRRKPSAARQAARSRTA